jgi:YfiH family protein
MSAWLEADWPAPPGVRALTTTRHGLGVSLAPFDAFNLGARCGDDPEAVAENRRQLEVALHLPSPPRWLRQVHGIDVVRFAPSLSPQAKGRAGERFASPEEQPLPNPPLQAREGVEAEPEADASVTSAPGTVLAILTADCLPVVLAARDGCEIAAAHAGWPGLSAGMLEATLTAMRTPAARLQAWIGPAAGPERYEIGEEVRERFMAHDPGVASAFVATRPGHWRVDLFAIARMRLAEAGLDPACIHGGGVCTISDPRRFFSHRRDQRGGRIATLAWIAPSA